MPGACVQHEPSPIPKQPFTQIRSWNCAVNESAGMGVPPLVGYERNSFAGRWPDCAPANFCIAAQAMIKVRIIIQSLLEARLVRTAVDANGPLRV
jgi:hypothetical protein